MPPSPDQTIDIPALIGEPVRDALDGIDLPMYVIDREGVLRWANRAASRLVGASLGRSLVSVVPREIRTHVQTQIARSLVGGEATVHELALTSPDGRLMGLRVRSAPIRSAGRNVAVFSLGLPIYDGPTDPPAPSALTPRQTEVLRLLSDGLTTEGIAAELGIALETARNHIRAVLRRLGVHSRLEAVVEGRHRGLIDD